MREVAELLNSMREAGVITNYALFGAMAQMRYTEPVATLDADVLVAVPHPESLNLLEGIYAFCAARGFVPEGEAIRVGDWPVQFIPAYNDLSREAMEKAQTVDFEGVPFRVAGADYLAAIALDVGRAKDFARILALLESGGTTEEQIGLLAARHGLHEKWSKFRKRFCDG